MFKLPCLAATSAALALACPTLQAQTAQVFVQNAQTVGSGNAVRLHGLPIRLPSGQVVYWDTTLLITANPTTGKPSSAQVQATTTPRIGSTEFVTGTYSDVSPYMGGCQLFASAFAGRTQFDLNCGSIDVFSWWTGPIAGHPYEAAIRAAGLDGIVGADELTWGRTMLGNMCFQDYAGAIFSARQVGDLLTLVSYGDDTVIGCQEVLTRVPTP